LSELAAPVVRRGRAKVRTVQTNIKKLVDNNAK
jgi:hypothetical protein